MTQDLSLTTRPIGGTQGTSHWKSAKRQRTLSLSDAGWELCSQMAAETQTNRSEVLEILIRWAEANRLDLLNARSRMLQP